MAAQATAFANTLDETGKWVWSFLRNELTPYPGRAWVVARVTIAATIVMLLVMTFQIPNGFLGAIFTLFLSRENPTATFVAGLRTIAAFLLGLAVIHRMQPLHHWALVDLHLWQMSIVLSLQASAIAGLLISLMTWVLVAVATPAPVYIAEVAMAQARVLQDRIPEELRERLMRNVA